MEDEIHILVGNPGSGKSTLCGTMTSRDGKTNFDFPSGISIGRGMTTLSKFLKYKDGAIIGDTPGLSDIDDKSNISLELENAFKIGTIYKLVFVITIERGRVRSEDIRTINTVLESIGLDINPEISYGIVFNKINKEVDEYLTLSSFNENYGQFLLKVPNSIFKIRFKESLFDENNMVFDNETKENFQNWLNIISLSKINPENVKFNKKEKEIKSYEKETPSVQIQEIQENPEVQENQKGENIQVITEDQEVQGNQVVQKNQEVQDNQEVLENQVIQEHQEVQEKQKVQDNQEDQGVRNQVIQEPQEIQENPEVQGENIQVIKEDQEVQGNQVVQINQEVQDNHEVLENQVIQDNQEVLENQDDQGVKNQVIHEPQEIQSVSNQEVEEPQEIQKPQEVQEPQEVQKPQEVQSVNNQEVKIKRVNNQEVQRVSIQDFHENQFHKIQKVQEEKINTKPSTFSSIVHYVKKKIF